MMIVDTPGFQNPEQGGAARGASFEELCHNYAQDRLQGLFHERTFVQELERYKEVALGLARPAPSPQASPSGLGPSGRASVEEGTNHLPRWLLPPSVCALGIHVRLCSLDRPLFMPRLRSYLVAFAPQELKMPSGSREPFLACL